MNKTIFTLAIGLLFMSGCTDTSNEFNVVYNVEFVADWSSDTHPTDFPSNAHFSPLVVLSHTTSLDPVGIGLAATPGVKEMAETGNTVAIEEEYQEFISNFQALDFTIGNVFDSPGMSSKVEIIVTNGNHTVSVLSQLAPSPDWFVSVTTSLLDPADGLWYDEVEAEALIYDAGSDSGTSFSSADAPTNPQEAIAILNSGPLTEGSNSVTSLGKFIFKRIK